MADLGAFPKAVVGIVVAVLIIVSLAVPVIGDFNTSTIMTKNNAGVAMEMIDDESHTVSVNMADLKVTVDSGTAYSTGTNNVPLFYSDHGVIMAKSDGSIDGGYESSGTWASLRVSSVTALSVAMSNGTATVTYTVSGAETTKTFAYDSFGFYILDTGKYVANIVSGSTLYYNDIDDVYAWYNTVGNTQFWYMHGTDVYKNGTKETQTMQYTQTKVTDGLYSLAQADYKFEPTSGTSSTVQWTVCEKTVSGLIQPNNQYATILNIVPLLLVIGVVIGAVSLVTMRKN